MAEHDGNFSPDLPDEALEQHLNRLSAENEQLVSALHEQYSVMRARQRAGLARGWERIQEARQPAPRFAEQTRQEALTPAQYAIKRNLPMKERPSDTQRPNRFKRVFNILIAAALLAVLAGSLALVYGHLRSHQTGLGSGNSGGPVTAAPGQVSPTPGQVSPTPTQGQRITNCQQSLSWPYGQSTYWANYRYHQLTGHWVCWTGNANQWVAGARAAGWHVSNSPHLPSILVLMPYVQGASAYGHPAVVENLVNATTVRTSNMNWAASGGGFGKVSYVNFTIGAGVYFIWR